MTFTFLSFTCRMMPGKGLSSYCTTHHCPVWCSAMVFGLKSLSFWSVASIRTTSCRRGQSNMPLAAWYKRLMSLYLRMLGNTLRTSDIFMVPLIVEESTCLNVHPSSQSPPHSHKTVSFYLCPLIAGKSSVHQWYLSPSELTCQPISSVQLPLHLVHPFHDLPQKSSMSWLRNPSGVAQ